MRAPITDKQLLEMMWERFPEIMNRGAEQPQQEAWEHHAKKLTHWLYCMSYNDSYFGEPAGLVKQVTGELNRLIGTSPQPAQRKPLTDAQITKCWGQAEGTRHGYVAFARAIEAAHGIKENT